MLKLRKNQHFAKIKQRNQNVIKIRGKSKLGRNKCTKRKGRNQYPMNILESGILTISFDYFVTG